jgi:hypothetical protein
MGRDEYPVLLSRVFDPQKNAGALASRGLEPKTQISKLSRETDPVQKSNPAWSTCAGGAGRRPQERHTRHRNGARLTLARLLPRLRWTRANHGADIRGVPAPFLEPRPAACTPQTTKQAERQRGIAARLVAWPLPPPHPRDCPQYRPHGQSQGTPR